MVKEFQNKNEWALILGGSSGLGLATAKKLANHGMNICIVHRSPRSQMKSIEKCFQEIKNDGIEFISFNKDAVNSSKVEEILSELIIKLGKHGKIKVMVHSIAKGNLKPMISNNESNLQTDDFQITINAMAISLYTWFKSVFSKNLFTKDARVVSFTSEGNAKPLKAYAAVSAAKSSLESISRNIALEFSQFGIRSNCIQAGVTDTPSLKLIPNSEEIKEYKQKRNPLGRLTEPEDVANVVYLLCKDEASWINGTIIKVDGGESLI